MDEDKDVEIEAMGAVSRALSPLEDEQRGRVIRWVAERFGVSISTISRRAAGGRNSADDTNEELDQSDEAGDSQSAEWEHFADLYDAAGPSTNPNKMLAAAYWVQYVEGKNSFGSLELNKLLKDLGHGVPDTAHTMTSLINQKPSLILQIKKSGKSRQARKTYKVTSAGQKAVEQMIGANGA